MTPALTEAQAAILRAMREGVLHWSPSEFAYYIGERGGTLYPRGVMLSVYSAGYANPLDDSLTPTGLAALAAYDAQHQLKRAEE